MVVLNLNPGKFKRTTHSHPNICGCSVGLLFATRNSRFRSLICVLLNDYKLLEGLDKVKFANKGGF